MSAKLIPLFDIAKKMKVAPNVARRRLRAALPKNKKVAPARDERWEFTPGQIAEVKKVISG